jgi:hypothetical protein
LTGIDPIGGKVAPLYHPRLDEWDKHFRMEGASIEGITPIGRATVRVLAMNDARRVELRAALWARSLRSLQ